MSRQTIDDLNAMDAAGFEQALANVLELAPWAARAAASQRPFNGVTALYDALCAAVRAAHDARRLDLLNQHPDLAGKAAIAGDLTSESRAEQGSAGLDRLSEAEFSAFSELNAAYRRKFGFPFIICVKRQTKDAILEAFEARKNNDPAAERETAEREVLRIAALRLTDLVEGPDPLPVHGRLSTHVLDTKNGVPAQGVKITLIERAARGESRILFEGETNTDGRTDRPLIGGAPVPIGRYELRFDIGDYFGEEPDQGPPFLDVVPIRFGVSEPEANYHIPLLASPWSYTTYRGS
ncbi:MAG: 2-oxo-4-hydroxy-4-carboxy-5-ureidoimidazoline decarboxylase [Alphaproteobacteria bacterium]|nr:2-oxo-4-hydroxy-4-carboxy-5-ureidoimidazoline decarboxylase [Alphaproteobacteria bacterium]